MTQRVSFDIRRRERSSALEFVPAIDGEPLTRLVRTFEVAHGYETDDRERYGGLIPGSYSFGSAREHYGPSGSDKSPLLGCQCGEWGCWPLLARITATDRVVRWTEFEQPFRDERDYASFGPFVFDASAYAAAVDAIGPAWASL